MALPFRMRTEIKQERNLLRACDLHGYIKDSIEGKLKSILECCVKVLPFEQQKYLM